MMKKTVMVMVMMMMTVINLYIIVNDDDGDDLKGITSVLVIRSIFGHGLGAAPRSGATIVYTGPLLSHTCKNKAGIRI